ncbi:uncharacterized protein G2W53_019675 [Senna tora]|uniref:Uncharacterized protein n=1 Tax=Senna tora TaxID=362788 RepID=A0A834TXE2_9FABA|nr:uncharacterized protein G2W53_019675 [Senna tora]
MRFGNEGHAGDKETYVAANPTFHVAIAPLNYVSSFT